MCLRKETKKLINRAQYKVCLTQMQTQVTLINFTKCQFSIESAPIVRLRAFVSSNSHMAMADEFGSNGATKFDTLHWKDENELLNGNLQIHFWVIYFLCFKYTFHHQWAAKDTKILRLKYPRRWDQMVGKTYGESYTGTRWTNDWSKHFGHK